MQQTCRVLIEFINKISCVSFYFCRYKVLQSWCLKSPLWEASNTGKCLFKKPVIYFMTFKSNRLTPNVQNYKNNKTTKSFLFLLLQLQSYLLGGSQHSFLMASRTRNFLGDTLPPPKK